MMKKRSDIVELLDFGMTVNFLLNLGELILLIVIFCMSLFVLSLIF